MKNIVLRILLFLSILFTSCEKRDIIEIYLTKERVESFDGVALESNVSDSLIRNNIKTLYGENLRYDSVKDQILYMGRFTSNIDDLESKPFISDSEIVGLNIQESRVYFSQSVQERFYNRIGSWQKEGGFVGKQFVICLNGKIVSTGYFDTMWNRFPCFTNCIKFYPKDKESEEVGFLIDSANIDLDNLGKKSSLINVFRKRKLE